MFKKIAALIFLFKLNCNSQININIWRAGKNVDKNNTVHAKKLYLKVLKKHPESYRANSGMGLLLSECTEEYSKAIPYLEKAAGLSKKDTVADIIYALAKSYEYTANFNKALWYLNKLNNVKAFEDDNQDFKSDLKKRKTDCDYSLKNFRKETTNKSDSVSVENLGNVINTEFAEYVPVFNNNNELIFTAKRKKRKYNFLNLFDITYSERIYTARIENSKFDSVKEYKPLADKKNKYLNKTNNESVISVTQDGSKLFVYRNGEIYETDLNNSVSKPKSLAKTINYRHYQSHAFLTKDGNTLYFTTDSRTGLGKTDIYVTKKIGDKKWSTPENLGETINTPYEEDAPFVTDDGQTLYFSSNGRPGFGGFDIYKCSLENGKWSAPKNVGQPINSTGNDIFYTEFKGFGYFASSREGGFGNMDIYKIIYLKK